MDLDAFKTDAQSQFDKHEILVKQLKKVKKLDNLIHTLHSEVFEEIDCLKCANCCKTTSPVFYETDIERASKSLKMKSTDFIVDYLHKDEDDDFVLNETPCPFLGHDNSCIIYENRPKACREYPHTNRKRIKQILNLTLKNTQVCPAVNEIFKRINQQL